MKNTIVSITAFLISVSIISCDSNTKSGKEDQSNATEQAEKTTQEANNVKVLGADEFYQKLEETEDPQLIDVRTPEEYSEGNIEGSENINFSSDEFERRMDELDKDEPIFVYCASGNRSGRASKMLKEKGFSEIYDLKGGYNAWPH